MSDFAIGSWNQNDPEGRKTVETTMDNPSNENPRRLKLSKLDVHSKSRQIIRYDTAWKPKNPKAVPERKFAGTTIMITANKLAKDSWKGAIETLVLAAGNDSENQRIIVAGMGDKITDIMPGEIVQDDATGLYRFHFSADRIKKLPILEQVFESNFREGATKEIKTKFSPRVTSMFIATLYDLDFEVYWIDLLALLEVLAYYNCDLGRLIDFFFNFGSFVKEELYKPFWHRLTRQYSTKLVGDVTELEHFKNQYLKHPTNAEFKDDLDEVVGNSSECFYYKCRYDARFLWLRNRIENRGEFSNESIRKEFLSALDDLGVAEVLNEYLPKKRLGFLLRANMLVSPNPDYWNVKPGEGRHREFKFIEEIHRNQVGRILQVYAHELTVVVEWITCQTDDTNLVKGPGEALAKRSLRKLPETNDKMIFRYESGRKNIHHLKLAKTFVP